MNEGYWREMKVNEGDWRQMKADDWRTMMKVIEGYWRLTDGNERLWMGHRYDQRFSLKGFGAIPNYLSLFLNTSCLSWPPLWILRYSLSIMEIFCLECPRFL